MPYHGFDWGLAEIGLLGQAGVAARPSSREAALRRWSEKTRSTPAWVLFQPAAPCPEQFPGTYASTPLSVSMCVMLGRLSCACWEPAEMALAVFLRDPLDITLPCVFSLIAQPCGTIGVRGLG